MPEIFRSGNRIPEIKGRVRRGLAVLIHSPTEAAALKTMIATLQLMPGDPLNNAYRIFSGPGVDLAGWVSAQPITPSSGMIPDSREMPVSPASSLIAALGFAQNLWAAQEDEVHELALILALPRPQKQNRGRRVIVESGRRALVLDAGSVRAKLVDADVVRPRNFGMILFPVGRSRRQGNLVEALRSRAEAGAKEALPRLEAVSQAQVTGKSTVVVFLHGLMSTDLGTFDGLLQRLRKKSFDATDTSLGMAP